jgi:WD40 repeat protein
VQEQQQGRLAIGWIDGKKLEIIVFGQKPEMRDYPLGVSALQSATLDAASGLIFGTAQDPRNNELVAVESDGKIVWRNPDLAVHANPVVSPTKDRLAVLARDKRTGVDGLYVVENQGQKITLISRNGLSVSWSPEGTNLLYDEGSQIVVYNLESNQRTQIANGTFPSWSPDGRWITFRTDQGKFVLADRGGKVQRELLDSKNILTGLSWSPDSKFLMYVEKAGAWERGPCASNLADGRDVMVYRLRDAQKGKVFQVCDGFPFQQLDWVRVPASVALSQLSNE